MMHSDDQIQAIREKYNGIYNENLILSSKTVPEWFTLPNGKKTKLGDKEEWVITKCAHNYAIIIEHSLYPNKISYNTFAERLEFKGKAAQNEDYIAIKMDMEKIYGCAIKTSDVEEATVHVSRQNKYDELTNRIKDLPPVPQGAVRYLETCPIVLFGAPDTIITRAYARKWMIGAIARGLTLAEVYVEGALILFGPQAINKTYFFKNIALDSSHYCGSKVDLTDTRKVAIAYAGKHIIELNELTQFAKMDMNEIKQFMTQTADVFDRKYENQSTTQPRRFILGGSTNSSDFLSDSSGNRRFWVIPVQKFDIDLFEKIKTQLWSEAYEAYLQCDKDSKRAPWVLTPEEIELCNETNQAFSKTDIYYSYVYQFLAECGKKDIIAHEINDYLKTKTNTYTVNIVAEIMQQKFGWIKKVKNDGTHYIANADSVIPELPKDGFIEPVRVQTDDAAMINAMPDVDSNVIDIQQQRRLQCQ